LDDHPVSSPLQSNADVIVHLLTEALAVLDADPAKAGRAIRLARGLASPTQAANTAVSGGLADWRMQRVLDYVHDNLSERLRIQQVAALLNVSTGYLSRAFKAAAGMTYSDYVARARLDLAKRLLLTSDMPISEIALACGAHDQPYLTRVFKRAVGMTPAAWRRQYGQGVGGAQVDGRLDGLELGLPVHEGRNAFGAARWPGKSLLDDESARSARALGAVRLSPRAASEP